MESSVSYCAILHSKFIKKFLKFIPFSLKKESLAKLHKRKIYYILGKKNYCSGEGLEDYQNEALARGQKPRVGG